MKSWSSDITVLGAKEISMQLVESTRRVIVIELNIVITPAREV